MLIGHRTLFRNMAALLAMLPVVAACAPDASERFGGETHWIDVADGQLKTQVFASEKIDDRPVLILILHGDIPDPRPNYQYFFAKAITQGFSVAELRAFGEEMPKLYVSLRAALGDAWGTESVVAAGVLRPGYADPSGDRSSGEMGMAIADNYTPKVVDALATVARELKSMYNPRAVVLVGHSGGGALAADILGRHPDLADAALLVGCACDPAAWRARMRVARPSPIWDRPNPSLLPLSLATSVSKDTVVRLVVGEEDDVAIPEDSRKYAKALQEQGIDARLTVVPSLGHNILITPASFRELALLVKKLDGDVSPTQAPAPDDR